MPRIFIGYMALLVAAALLIIVSRRPAPEAPPKPEVVEEVPRLVDFDLFWHNQYQVPVDQISVQDKVTGRIFEANITRVPYVEPGKTGLFTAVLDLDVCIEVTTNGFKVINVRTR